MSDNQYFLNRLKEFIDKKNMSVNSFEKLCGFKSGIIRNAIHNQGAIGSDKIVEILINFPDINLYWLFLGKGDMIKESEIQESQEQYIISNNSNNGNNVINKVCEEKVKGLEMVIEKQNEEIQFLRSLLKKS